MASHQELVVEWTMLDSDYNNWTEDDLQLAAELGTTLLERNEELENELKSQQITIEDQAQEILFLTKQITSMKEESLSRTKVYEQLELSLSDLEKNKSDLSRKHELDKKRIQSMCENIDYLERKCEELSGTLESLREANKKHYNGKINQSGYFNFGSSDSSEDDSGCGYGFRRRSQSLQELRDYTPSPDDLDSNHSNSPDLKISEAEFVGALDAKVEELIGAKKKEVEKITQLENQLRILIQENSNLQQKLYQVTSEKNELIEDLRIQLLDQSAVLSQQTRGYNHQSIFPTPLMSPDNIDYTHAFTNSTFSSINNLSSPLSIKSTLCKNNRSMCKRCSTEINILNLVNSIEIENEDYSSLEFEMARAEEEAQNSNSYKKSSRNDFENLFGKSILDCCLDEEAMSNFEASTPEEDACLVKDYGPEVFMKNCDDSDVTSKSRKLKLPDKIPAVDMYSSDLDKTLQNDQVGQVEDNENSDQTMVLNNPSSPEPIIRLKKRSKILLQETIGEPGELKLEECSAISDTKQHTPGESVPEYKLILQNMFNLFQTSRTLYPALPGSQQGR